MSDSFGNVHCGAKLFGVSLNGYDEIQEVLLNTEEFVNYKGVLTSGERIAELNDFFCDEAVIEKKDTTLLLPRYSQDGTRSMLFEERMNTKEEKEPTSILPYIIRTTIIGVILLAGWSFMSDSAPKSSSQSSRSLPFFNASRASLDSVGYSSHGPMV